MTVVGFCSWTMDTHGVVFDLETRFVFMERSQAMGENISTDQLTGHLDLLIALQCVIAL